MESRPTSAYRLQLSEHFSLAQATSLLRHLAEMGIDALYLSPIATARSSHGYDIIDPNRLNPKLGSEEAFDAFCTQAKALGLRIILDIVPNHMGICGGNLWWEDVLKLGERSPYASYFDIDWASGKPELEGRVLLPILGDAYGAVLERGEITIHRDNSSPFLTYGEHRLPLDPKTYRLIPKRSSVEGLHTLLEAQNYRLACWKVAAHEINYRRFFTIHELAALCIEQPKVLRHHHRWIFELLKREVIDGVRVDHPDGLYDPAAYFKELRKQGASLILVEKILERNEELPPSWDVEGTVGYEYLNLLTGVFVAERNETCFTSIYEAFIGEKSDYRQIMYASKRLLAETEMLSEVEALGRALDQISERELRSRDFTRVDLTRALAAVLVAFPVYRTYITPQGKLTPRDAREIAIAIEQARKAEQTLDPAIFAFIEKVLLLQLPEPDLDFVMRFQQLTGPLMAKGVEDTAFYRYNRCIALNEVGGDPLHFGRSATEFHTFNLEKLERWPYGLLASSTHDTKRSEDVRMRLAALSDLPKQWQQMLRACAKITADFAKPSPNLEYFIYQTLIGSWPIALDRLWEVILKSMREAKEETSWMHPDADYEARVYTFLEQLLASEDFMESFLPLQQQVAKLGEQNSLAALILKLGSCGIFELYQGNEQFTYRLVDPDNRQVPSFAAEDEKARITHLGLRYRQQHPELFLQGDYIPLKAKEEVIAFAREWKGEAVVIIVSRFPARWKGAEVLFPLDWSGSTLYDLITENTMEIKPKGQYGHIYLPKEKWSVGLYERR